MYTVLRLVSVLIFPSVRQQICFMTMSHRGKLPPVHFSTFLKKLLDMTQMRWYYLTCAHPGIGEAHQLRKHTMYLNN